MGCWICALEHVQQSDSPAAAHTSLKGLDGPAQSCRGRSDLRSNTAVAGGRGVGVGVGGSRLLLHGVCDMHGPIGSCACCVHHSNTAAVCCCCAWLRCCLVRQLCCAHMAWTSRASRGNPVFEQDKMMLNGI
jgi:hypothetical protein